MLDATAIITNDAKTITKAQGVGPKVAQRVILELKDKIDKTMLDIADEPITNEESASRSEAMNALMVLGYSAEDAKRAVAKIDADLNVEEIIKKALVLLM